ncbi:MAG: hypothetical protein J5881_01005 [Clostridia bacterium]|nr:hypothetical protein [Clostridia bacterium]
MRENEFITIKKESLYEGNKECTVERAKLIGLMEAIKDLYIYNNEFSKHFVDILPRVKEITINVDRNKELDVPVMIFGTMDEPATVIPIPRCNKIIWGIFNEFIK